MNHTPGPWTTVHEGHRLSVWAEGYGFIHSHEVPAVNIGKTRTANANSLLIAVAPELLQALKVMLAKIDDEDSPWWMDCPDKGGFDVTAIRALIAKAEGT